MYLQRFRLKEAVMILVLALAVLQIPGSGMDRTVNQSIVRVGNSYQRPVAAQIMAPQPTSVSPTDHSSSMKLASAEYTTAALLPAVVPKTTVGERRAVRSPDRRLWLTLGLIQHSAATFDAWTTRYKLQEGRYRETNPLLKPFAGNASIYVVVQAAPFAMDFTGRKMQRSRNRVVRKLWWLPQTAQAATSIYFGITNLQK
jgi:hypothetical protein